MSKRYLGFIVLGCVAALTVVSAAQNASRAQVDMGKAAFDRRCQPCHGNEAAGGLGPPLVPFTHDDKSLLGIVRNGGNDMVASTVADISDAEVAAVGVYLRTLKPKGAAAPQGSPQTPEAVAAAEAQRAGRPANVASAPKVAAGTVTLPAAAQHKFTPVTTAMLENPSPNDWLNWRRTLDGWGYSPLNQINKQNANRLQMVWSWELNPGNNEATPLIYDGVLYIPNPNGGIQALDAATGDPLWSFKKDIETQPVPLMPTYTWDDFSGMRNIAIYGDKIFLATHDAHILGIDARNGKVVWDTTVANYRQGYRYTSGPIIVKGKVVTGMTGCERFKNDVCFITAHDPDTGKELWRTSTVARPGEPGGDTWGNLPLTFRAGSDVWIPGTYDPKTNLTYWSTSQAKPWARVSRRTDGDVLYTNSVLALNPETGKIVWYHQLIPGETHDEDEVFENVLIDHDGSSSLFKMGKLGILWELDRKNGNFVDAHDLGYQSVGTIDRTKGQLAYKSDAIPKLDMPLDWCGNVRNWPATAYHPDTHALYIPAGRLSCQTSVYSLMDQVEGGGGRWYGEKTVGSYPNPASPVKGGQFIAMDIKTGKVLWRHETSPSTTSAALTTGGGLAIVGDGDRYLWIHDAATGAVLFRTRLPASPRGFPVTYAVRGRQYIAVPTNGRAGNQLFVFAVPEDRPQTR
jgi:alcohol dehydrogenase (cytochrome c)